MARKSLETKPKNTGKTLQSLQTNPQQSQITKEKFTKNKKVLAVVGVGLLIIIILLFLFKGIFIATMVNGEPISRISVIKELEKQNGKAILENLITKKLILQEARKRNIEVTEAEIDEELKKIEESLKTQGTTLDDALLQQSMSRDQLISEIKIQFTIQKIVGSDVKVSDKEIDDFVEQNKTQFPEEATEAQMKEEAKKALEQQKIQEKTQAFLEEIRTKANIQTFVQY